jgi:ketosteroid isomerase-like protein
MTTGSEEALSVAKSFIAALERRDSETMTALLHDDVVLESPYPVAPGENMPGSRRCEGRSVHDHFRNIDNVVASLEFHNDIWRTTTDGLAVFQADGRATLPDGTPYNNHYLMMFSVANGQILHWYEYFSPVCAARANAMPLELIP